MNENQNANMSRKEYNKLQAKQIGNSSSVFDGKEFLLRLADVELPSGSTTIWECPDGYIFKDENGNVINATKIVLEKKKQKYPNTVDRCRAIVGAMSGYGAFGYQAELITSFISLLICRDAYWKIAGEEMGLEKPWEPSGNEDCFVISRSCGEVYLYSSAGDCEPFEFPTEEMRDAFYENFKKEIEMCKELL